MDNMLIEYGAKFWDIGYELKVDMRYNGSKWMYMANLTHMSTQKHEAGGGFNDPLEMFDYLDWCMDNYTRTGSTLPTIRGGSYAHPSP